MGFLISDRWDGVTNNTMSATQASGGSNTILALTRMTAKCDTAATLSIYNNSSAGTLRFQVRLLADEGYGHTWPQDDPLVFPSNTAAYLTLSATGTASNINYAGFTQLER